MPSQPMFSWVLSALCLDCPILEARISEQGPIGHVSPHVFHQPRILHAITVWGDDIPAGEEGAPEAEWAEAETCKIAQL